MLYPLSYGGLLGALHLQDDLQGEELQVQG